MAKKFMYVCFGILALVVVFHLGARYGSASIVDQSTTGIVAQWHGGQESVLLDNGEVWMYSNLSGWEYDSHGVPIPVSQIKFIGDDFLVDTDNQAWHYIGGSWVNVGSPPSLVSTEPTTWGRIKAEFAE